MYYTKYLLAAYALGPFYLISKFYVILFVHIICTPIKDTCDICFLQYSANLLD